MIGPVMAGMIIFFVFFTGANSASMIIQEDEDGTLARLYTTPTSLKKILGGKLASVVVTLAIQVFILLFASRFIFNIQWGAPLTVLPVIVGLVSAASGFGIFLMSFIRTSQQAGIVQGGVMTLMGMLGGLFTAFIQDTPAALNTIALFTPQGWAMRSMKLALAGARPLEVLVPVAILLAMGFIFYMASIFTFRRRFD
jgi:ABC-2 type transport system permease protein